MLEPQLASSLQAPALLLLLLLLLLHPVPLLLDASMICPPWTPYVHAKRPAAVALPHHVVPW